MGEQGRLVKPMFSICRLGKNYPFFRASGKNAFSGRITSSDDQYDEFYDKLWPESDR